MKMKGVDSMRVKSNLKQILEQKGISIRKLSEDTEIGFESIRRLANDTTTQYQRDTIGKVCKVLDIKLCELLELTEED